MTGLSTFNDSLRDLALLNLAAQILHKTGINIVTYIS
jgi:hypothetical protein